MSVLRFISCFVICAASTALLAADLLATDWSRFRGPGGAGVAVDSAVPTQWSPEANLGWKTELPGPGVSSPIIVGGKAFVTCYSGYGLSQEEPGEIENLVRHLVCVDLETGEKIWQKDVKAALPEDPYAGIGVTAHGYASHTPVSDGKNIYAFFGKTGVHAYDLDGNSLWNADVGMESDPTKWGSSSSPILYKETVIVTASAESQAIIGFDKSTGKELWRQEAEGLDGMWGTPTLVKVDEGRTDLVMCVAKELWGLDPESGELRWFAQATGAEQAHSSVISGGGRVFAFTGRGGGSVSVQVGGSGDVSDSNTIWSSNEKGSFSSPVGHQSKIYVVADGVVTIVDGRTGERLNKARLEGAERTGGRFGSLDYPSPVVAGDHLYYLNGSGQMFVFNLSGEFKQIAVNRVTSAKESFGGSPAISDGRMLMRSDRFLYCVMDKGQTVAPSDNLVASTEPAPQGRAGFGGGRAGGQGAGAPRGGGRPDGEGGGRPDGGFGGGGGPGGGRGAGGRGNWDPMSIFTGRDANQDGKLTADELSGSPMADRMGQMDKDGDKAISKEEFRAGMGSMFGGGRGGRGGQRGGGGGGSWGGRGEDKRPDRPQRPAMAG